MQSRINGYAAVAARLSLTALPHHSDLNVELLRHSVAPDCPSLYEAYIGLTYCTPHDTLLISIAPHVTWGLLKDTQVMQAYSKIDWFSWTVPLVSSISGEGEGSYAVILGLVRKHLDFAASKISELSFGDWGSGRAPYRGKLHLGDLGLTVFFGGNVNHVLYELSGVGCEVFSALGLLDPLLKEWGDRCTRLDIAADFETDVTPEVFAAARDGERFKSGAVMHSESGTTVYVGSQKSDRFARVYRYAEPHPRANLLRCEMILRSEQAKTAVASYLDVGLNRLVGSVGSAFGWSHDLWVGTQWQGEALSYFRPQRGMGGTTRWLMVQVLPALQRLVSEGNRADVEYFRRQLDELLNNE